MMRTVHFRVEGVPRAKAKKLGLRAGHAFGYNDAKTANFQSLVTMAARSVVSVTLAGLLSLDIVAVYPRTKAQLPNAKGRLPKGVSKGRIPMGSKPDWDNLAKSICDGINAAGVWEDDARVCDGRVRKFRVAIGELPCVEVRISEVAE